MLGFGALGEFAIGEGPSSQRRGAFSQFSQPTKKARSADSGFSGFIPPRPAQVARSFSAFSQQPAQQRKTTQAGGSWAFVPPAAQKPFAIFTPFSQPLTPPARYRLASLLGSTAFVPGEMPDITSRVILHDPIDYYMEGLPQFRGLGRTFEPGRGEGKTEGKIGRSGRKRLTKPSSFTSKTDKRGYD